MNEVEQQTIQDNDGEDSEVVSINSVQFNKKPFHITCQFKNICGPEQYNSTN